MNIVTYKPTTSLLDWADSLFDDFNNDRNWGIEGHHYPVVDVKQNKEGYSLEADLAGLSEKDIDVKVENNLLTISYKKQEANEEKENGYLLRERRSSSFSRSFVLPEDVDRSKIEADFKNGVLTLTLAKSPETKPKKIEIKAH